MGNERNIIVFLFPFRMNRNFSILFKDKPKVIVFLLYKEAIYHASISYIFLQYYTSFGLKFHSLPFGLYFDILRFIEASEFLYLFQNCRFSNRLALDQIL